ncbi:MAG: hypothetical protein ACI9C4_002398 [Paraglaciecola sp.]|jgi:hypothetical protein
MNDKSKNWFELCRITEVGFNKTSDSLPIVQKPLAGDLTL